ncbi:hypothetical protein G7Y89_g309 [Cudoniella acicularis]|uniref:Uncharacterized protein n=1 Tax=Cudoniella acicularis TaxID=354080 RepID=A0A8H4RXC8_9HELO|nr:hypothetical protein G7Y89_g309 [Cudoniella acicularis]
MASPILATSSEHNPRRVVLRLKVSDFKGCGSSEYDNAIKAYLLFAGRLTNEHEMNKHYAHIEPFQSPELQQTSFHIIIDIEKYMIDDGEFRNLPHEIYRIRRNEQGIFSNDAKCLTASILLGAHQHQGGFNLYNHNNF